MANRILRQYRTLRQLEADRVRDQSLRDKKARQWLGEYAPEWVMSAINESLSASYAAGQRNGIRLAASVAADYDKYNSHPYLVSDCILLKLNSTTRKPRKNRRR